MRITAREARELSTTVEQKTDEAIDSICERIAVMAKEQKRMLRAGYDYDKDPQLWIHGGYFNTPEWRYATEVLRKLGFKVTFYYKELQFVDMYTLIEW